MAYGEVDTGGGLAGGLSRGLASGVGLASSLIGQAQQAGFQQRQEARLDAQTQVALHQARAETIRGMLDDANDQIAGLAKSGASDDVLTAAIQRKQALNDQLYGANGAIVRATGGQVLGGVQQTMADANALKTGQTTPQAIGPDRLFNVAAVVHPQPIALVDDYDHPAGVTPVGDHLDNLHSGMQTGNHAQVLDASSNLLGHTASPYHPDDERHTPGMALPVRDPNDPNAHYQAAGDALGHIATAHAAINSDHPGADDIRDMLIKAHEAGGQDRVNFARQVLYMSGGVRGLAKTISTPDESEQKFMFLKGQLKNANMAAGMSDADADAKATQDAINRVARDPMEIEMARIGGEKEVEGMRAASAEKVEGERAGAEYGVERLRAQALRDVANTRANAPKGTLESDLNTIQEQVNSGNMTPEEGAAQRQARINSESHRYDKNQPRGGTGAVTDADLHKQAAAEAEKAVAANPDLDIGDVTLKLYHKMKDDRDNPPPAAGAAPAAAQAQALPPQAMAQLKEDRVTTFGNGTKWTIRGGKPVQLQ